MPTYDYTCDLCGHEFEVFQRMSEKPLLECPDCNGMGLRRLIGTGAGVIFKGSGFYETDYKRKGNSAGAGSPEGKETESSSVGAKEGGSRTEKESPVSKAQSGAAAAGSGNK